MEPMYYTHVLRPDLRSSEATCRGIEGGASIDAASHRGSEKEERPHRCREDMRLLALRFSAGVLHGPHGDSRAATHTALSEPAGATDDTDENQNQHTADGSGREPQQAATSTRPVISANCWRATRKSMAAWVRCCASAGRRWCGWSKQKAR